MFSSRQNCVNFSGKHGLLFRCLDIILSPVNPAALRSESACATRSRNVPEVTPAGQRALLYRQQVGGVAAPLFVQSLNNSFMFPS